MYFAYSFRGTTYKVKKENRDKRKENRSVVCRKMCLITRNAKSSDDADENVFHGY